MAHADPYSRKGALRLTDSAAPVVLAVVFSVVLLQPNWAVLNHTGFIDIENYLAGFNSGWYYYVVHDLPWGKFLLGEGVWITLVERLIGFTGDALVAFYIVSLTSLIALSFYVCRNARNVAFLLVLATPAMIDLVSGQLRSALGAAFFYVALMVPRPGRYALFVVAIGIHTVFTIYIAIYLIYHLIVSASTHLNVLRSRLACAIIALCGAALIVSVQGVALASIEDRRTDVYIGLTAGGLLLVGWMFFAAAAAFLEEGKRMSLDCFIFIFSSGLFIASNFAGLYGQRYVAMALPSFAVALSNVVPTRRTPLSVFYIAFTSVYFIYYIG